MPKNAKTFLKKPIDVKPTGNPFIVDENNPATVPIPNAVIITRIEGAYTEKDRKLWVFLVHAAWDDLLKKNIHEIPIYKINKVFRELGGDKGVNWIWESAKRLRDTKVDWEFDEDGERMQGVSNLMNAVTSKNARDTGRLRYEIPALLSEVIKQPFRFSRLRLHFMIGLSGKYAVTLYELLEGVANMKNPILEVEIEKLREWLKVPDGKLLRYIDFKRRVIDPALKQINDNSEGAGFSVLVEPIKDGRAVEKLRFNVLKCEDRLKDENGIGKEQAAPVSVAVAIQPGGLSLPLTAYDKAKAAAPGYDIYFLETEWKDWLMKTGKMPENPEAAFIAFCRKKSEKKPLR